MLKDLRPSTYLYFIAFILSMGWVVYKEGWLFAIVFLVLAFAVIWGLDWLSNKLDNWGRNKNRKS